MATGDFGIVVYNEFNFGFMITWKDFEKLQLNQCEIQKVFQFFSTKNSKTNKIDSKLYEGKKYNYCHLSCRVNFFKHKTSSRVLLIFPVRLRIMEEIISCVTIVAAGIELAVRGLVM